MGATETIAKWIVNTTYEDIPPDAIRVANESCFDLLGVILAGEQGWTRLYNIRCTSRSACSLLRPSGRKARGPSASTGSCWLKARDSFWKNTPV